MKSSLILSKQDTSQILNILKCILCIGVVIIHSKVSSNSICDYPRFEVFQYVFARLIVGRLCVPFFFVISGYFFFTRLEDKLTFSYFERKIKTRLRSILLPYLIANTLILLYVLLLREMLGLECTEGYNTLVACFWGHPVHGFPIDMPLWYLKDLLMLSIISPVLYFVIKRIGLVFLVITGILWYVDVQIPYNIVHDNFGSVLFFSIGAFFTIHKYDLVNFFSKRNIGISILFFYLLCLIITSITRNEYMAKTLSVLAFPVAIFITSSIYKRRTIGSDRGGGKFLFDKTQVTATFFVFLYHYYIPAPVTKIIAGLIANHTVEMSLYIQLLLGVAEKTAYLLFLYYMLRRFLPKATSIVVGGR